DRRWLLHLVAINERYQFIKRTAVAAAPFAQQPGYFMRLIHANLAPRDWEIGREDKPGVASSQSRGDADAAMQMRSSEQGLVCEDLKIFVRQVKGQHVLGHKDSDQFFPGIHPVTDLCRSSPAKLSDRSGDRRFRDIQKHAGAETESVSPERDRADL